MSKHTPGPWNVQFYPGTTGESPSDLLKDKDGRLFVGTTNGNVALVGNPSVVVGRRGGYADIMGETLANAALIAAAPDLLAFCKRMRELDDAGQISPDGHDTFSILSAADRKALDAAITAAEGGGA